MISLHLDTKNLEKHWAYSDDWRTIEDKKDVEIISRVIRSCVSSPIVWFNGKRKSDRFMFADWIVLDFDNGTKLEAALEMFKNYTHVIGTTKRHQLELDKDGNKIDRFRVWLLVNDRCSDLTKYVYNARLLAKNYGADEQAVDGARKFLPCKSIVSTNVGRKIILSEPVIKEKKEFYISKKSDKYIPKFIKSMLEEGVEDGKRNYSCYTIGKFLGSNGFLEHEIINMIMNSRVPKGSDCLSEVIKAVKSGLRRK